MVSSTKNGQLNFPMLEYPGFLLRVASHRSIARLAEKLDDIGLRVTEATILIMVIDNPDCKQSELGKSLDIASANLTTMLHRLEKQDLIIREPIDGRTNILKLTKQGVALAKKCQDITRAHEAEIIDTIAPTDLDGFKSALERLMKTFRD